MAAVIDICLRRGSSQSIWLTQDVSTNHVTGWLTLVNRKLTHILLTKESHRVFPRTWCLVRDRQCEFVEREEGKLAWRGPRGGAARSGGGVPKDVAGGVTEGRDRAGRAGGSKTRNFPCTGC